MVQSAKVGRICQASERHTDGRFGRAVGRPAAPQPNCSASQARAANGPESCRRAGPPPPTCLPNLPTHKAGLASKIVDFVPRTAAAVLARSCARRRRNCLTALTRSAPAALLGWPGGGAVGRGGSAARRPSGRTAGRSAGLSEDGSAGLSGGRPSGQPVVLMVGRSRGFSCCWAVGPCGPSCGGGAEVVMPEAPAEAGDGGEIEIKRKSPRVSKRNIRSPASSAPQNSRTIFKKLLEVARPSGPMFANSSSFGQCWPRSASLNHAVDYQLLAEACVNWAKCWPEAARFGRYVPHAGGIWPNLAMRSPASDNFGRCSSFPISAAIDHTLVC